MKFDRVCGLAVTLLYALLCTRVAAHYSQIPLPARMRREKRDNVLDEQLRKYFLGKWWWDKDEDDKADKTDDQDTSTDTTDDDADTDTSTDQDGTTHYGGDEDYQDHGNSTADDTDAPISGGGDHDYQPHGSDTSADGDDQTDTPTYGGDDHDYQPHTPVEPEQEGSQDETCTGYGCDGHDQQDHTSPDSDDKTEEPVEDEPEGFQWDGTLGPGRVQFEDDVIISDYIDIGWGESLYFAMAESRNDPATDPIIVWLQGGPGCSSMLAMFTENGPYNFIYNASSVEERFIFEKNEYSWNNNANVLYLDQPLGTGFSDINSFWNYRWNGYDIAYDFYVFMYHFFKKYPEFKHRELYLTGESYAGHYIPEIANFIHYNPHHWLNLQGIAIGNGWVDPFYQFKSYPNFAAANGLISIGHRYVLDIGYQICQFFLILRIPVISSTVCMFTGMSIATPGYPEFNLYDIREPCVTFGMCYPDDHLWQVMNSYDYRGLMNLPVDDSTTWEMCATPPHIFLTLDFDASLGVKLAPLLDKGMPILIYNGDKDYICNWMSGMAWTTALVWEGQQEFMRAPFDLWSDDYEEATIGGQVKNFVNFTFLKVHDSGHMVPMDQPKVALNMIEEFIQTKKITSKYEKDREALRDSTPEVEEDGHQDL